MSLNINMNIESGNGFPERRELASSFCAKHDGVVSDRYCHPCESLLCEDCTTDHEAHFVQKAGDVLKSTLSNIKVMQNQNMSGILARLQKESDSIDEDEQAFKSALHDIKSAMKFKYEAIQCKLTEQFERENSKLESFKTESLAKSSKRKEELKNKFAFISKLHEDIDSQRELDISKALLYEKKYRDIIKDRSCTTNAKSFFSPLPVYINTDISDETSLQIQNILGCVNYNVKVCNKVKPSVKNFIKQKPPIHPVYNLPVPPKHKVAAAVQTSANDIIVGYSTNKVLHYYDRNAKKLKIKEVSLYIHDFTSTSSGDLIASESKGTRVFKLTPTKSILLYDASKFTPLGVFQSKKSNYTFICCHNGEFGRIVVLNSDSKVVKFIERNENGDKYFSKPYRVTENNSSGDLYVTDPDRKRLLGLDESNREVFDYCGGPDEKNFIPIDVCHSQDKNAIFVSNWKGNNVHSISLQGAFLTYIVSAEDKILYPTSMLLDCLNRLWISHKEKISVIKFIT